MDRLIQKMMAVLLVSALALQTVPHSVADTEAAALIEQHLIMLEGGRNFRDLGGITTADGRSIKPGLLYRAGVLNHLTPEDYRQLETLNIRTLVDFRDSEERVNEPTQWQAGDVRVLEWDYSLSFGPASDDESGIEQMLMMLSTEAGGAEQMMATLYRSMVEQQRPHFQGLFQSLLDGDGPVLFHCTAGKDRTGIAAALIQTALGVDEETVFRDYTLSEAILIRAAEEDAPGAMTAHGDDSYAMLAMLPEEAVAALMGTRRSYLEAAFDEMVQRYGSVDAYIRDGLGLSEQDVETLRALYLQ